MELAELLTLRDKLKRAIYSGNRSITDDGKTQTFRSVDEMRRAVADLDAEISGQTNSSQIRVGRAVPARR